MLNINSLFQGLLEFIKKFNIKAYRTQMFVIVGSLFVVAISFAIKNVGGSVKTVGISNDKVATSMVIKTENIEKDETNDENKENSASLLPLNRDLVKLENTEESYLEAIVPFENNTNVEKSEQKETESETQTEAQMETQTEAQTESETKIEVQTEPETQVEIQTEPVVQQNNCGISLSDDDYYWLTKIVEAEAGNQDEIGKILVANVIFNRVRSGSFPNTVKSVIFQSNGRTYQFSPVKSGIIYDKQPSGHTVDCVNRALQGEDYSQGALFFTMKTSSRSWFNTSLKLLFVHGDHYFYTYY